LMVTDVLNTLMQKGTVPLRLCPAGCQKRLVGLLADTARTTRLGSYSLVCDANSPERVAPVKACLASGRPVVSTLYISETFEDAKDMWSPDEYEVQRLHSPGDTSHALLVVGYDDERFGGAFEVMNSWGTDQFGVEGYTWIRYSDFDHFCADSYGVSLDTVVVQDSTTSVPGPGVPLAAAQESNPAVPVISLPPPASTTLTGSLRLLDSHRKVMAVIKTDSLFAVNYPFRPATSFQIELSTNGDTFIYAISCDSAERKAEAAYSLEEDTSQVLGCTQIRIPSRVPTKFNRISGPPGVDYYCVLLSRTPLNLNTIVEHLNAGAGRFVDRVYSVMHVDRSAHQCVSVDKERYVLFDGGTLSGNALPVIFALRRGQ